jgi:hypothetical protein
MRRIDESYRRQACKRFGLLSEKGLDTGLTRIRDRRNTGQGLVVDIESYFCHCLNPARVFAVRAKLIQTYLFRE